MTRKSFEFTAGCLSLNFVDTVANPATTPHDLLGAPADFAKWIVAAFPYVNESPDVTESDLVKAKKLRKVISLSVTALVSGQDPDPRDIEFINDLAADPDLRPQWESGNVHSTAKDVAGAALASIAADAVLCMSNASAIRIRRCVECQMFFIDNTRAQNRRWCSSSSGCGNRAKVRRHRAAKAKSEIHDR